MKTYRNLFQQIVSIENLLLAARKAEKNKRYKGNTAHFNMFLEGNLLQLQNELETKKYKPGKYRSFKIYEPKERLISAAPYSDRVIHHALCNVIEPIFEKSFIYDSYANRGGKGTHKAILRYQKFARKNKYVLKIDIKKYFPSIVHNILKQQIRKKISCEDTLWLIDKIIDNSNQQEDPGLIFPGDDLFTNIEIKKGIPIGNLTSQFFANIYLNGLDHFIKEKLMCKYYIRYVDDMVIFENDKELLYGIKYKIRDFLYNLRLQLHERKTRLFRVSDGMGFLGHRVFQDFRLLKKENLRRFRKRLKKQLIMYKKGLLPKEKLTMSIQSWQGHAAFSNTFKLRQKILNELKAKGISLKMASCVAARGTTTRTTAVQQTATGTIQTTRTTTTGFV